MLFSDAFHKPLTHSKTYIIYITFLLICTHYTLLCIEQIKIIVSSIKHYYFNSDFEPGPMSKSFILGNLPPQPHAEFSSDTVIYKGGPPGPAAAPAAARGPLPTLEDEFPPPPPIRLVYLSIYLTIHNKYTSI